MTDAQLAADIRRTTRMMRRKLMRYRPRNMPKHYGEQQHHEEDDHDRED